MSGSRGLTQVSLCTHTCMHMGLLGGTHAVCQVAPRKRAVWLHRGPQGGRPPAGLVRLWILLGTPEGVQVVSEVKVNFGGRWDAWRHKVTMQRNEGVSPEALGPQRKD